MRENLRSSIISERVSLSAMPKFCFIIRHTQELAYSKRDVGKQRRHNVLLMPRQKINRIPNKLIWCMRRVSKSNVGVFSGLIVRTDECILFF